MKIEVKNLSKSYNKTDVVKNLNFSIDNISSLGIIGESGCGKSTLLRQLAGIENPDSGEILIDGISPINDKKIFQNDIGYVFQKHNLFPHLTIKENITLIISKVKKLKNSDVIADDVLKQLFIQDEKNKLPGEVSGGQAQRASIARALATNPKLIFLDEPTAALDPILTKEVLKAVVGLKNSGRNFIFVTHEMAFLKDFADYFIFIKGGKILEYGIRKQLDSPKTQELSDFLKTY